VRVVVEEFAAAPEVSVVVLLPALEPVPLAPIVEPEPVAVPDEAAEPAVPDVSVLLEPACAAGVPDAPAAVPVLEDEEPWATAVPMQAMAATAASATFSWVDAVMWKTP
jgi:hypothetical protein